MSRVTLIALLLLVIPLATALPSDVVARIQATGPNELTGYCYAEDAWSEYVQFTYQWNRNGTMYGVTTSTQLPRGREHALAKAVAVDLSMNESLTFECRAFDPEGATDFVSSIPFRVTDMPPPPDNGPYPVQLEQYCKQRLKGIVVKNNDGTWKCIASTTPDENISPESKSAGDSLLDIGELVWPSQPFFGLVAIVVAIYLGVSYLGERTKPKGGNKIGRINDDDGWY